MTRAAVAVGYIADADPAAHQASTLALLRAVTEPARVEGRYDFGSADLAARLGEMLVRLRLHERFSRIPPPDALFLHRKLGGLYLLLTRLRARIDVRALVMPFLDGVGNGPLTSQAPVEAPSLRPASGLPAAPDQTAARRRNVMTQAASLDDAVLSLALQE